MGQIRKFIFEQVAAKKISIESAKEMLNELADIGSESATQEPIAIIGMAARLPEADNQDEFWKNLISGKDCVTEFPMQRRLDIDEILTNEDIASRLGFAAVKDSKDLSKMYRKGGYLKEVDKFDAKFFNISPKEAQAMDPHQRLFLECAYEAIEDAGYGGNKLYGSSTGVFVGRDHKTETYYENLINDRDMLTLLGSWSAIMPSRLSFLLDLQGPSIVYDTACSSAMVALHNACMSLWNKECTMAVAGGITVGSGRIKVESGMHMVESEKDEVCSFDRKADGTVWSEGLGTFILKPLSKAVEDRDHIYALIKGSAINNDGLSNGITAPNSQAQKKVLQKAWENSNITPDTLSYIEAHGTGTNLGDPIEIKAITDAMRAYTNKKQFCAIGSVKSNLGHLQAASGVASLMKVVLSLQHRQIPPTIHFSEVNPYINLVDSPVYINDTAREWNDCSFPRRAGVSVFGLSGTNCHVVLEEYSTLEQKNIPLANDTQDVPELITMSAKDKNGIERLVKRYVKFLDNQILDFRNLCYTANSGRGHYEYRMAIIAKNVEDLKEKLELILQEEISETREESIYFGEYHKVLKNYEKTDTTQITEMEWRALSDEAARIIELKNDTKDHSIEMLSKIATIYVQGAEIDWNKFYQNQKCQKVSIPTYPYERCRFWAPLKKKSERKNQERDLFELGWIEEEGMKGSFVAGDILILKDKEVLADELIRFYRDMGYRVIETKIGNEFLQQSSDSFQIKNEQEDYEMLFSNNELKNVHVIIHLLSLDTKEECRTLGELEQSCNVGVNSAFKLIKGLSQFDISKNQDIKTVFVSQNVNEVTGKETYLRPEYNTMFGLVKAAGFEFRNITLRGIDIDENTSVTELAEEINSENNNNLVSLRNGRRHIEEFRVSRPKRNNASNIKLRDDGVYVITGGTGGIGLEIARHFASMKKCTLALINRSKFPDRSEWSKIIEANQNASLIKKVREIRAIEEYGVKVCCYSADISNYKDAEDVLEAIRRDYGKINGIIHSAGMAGQGYLITKSEETLKQVLLPKVLGTFNMDKLTRQDNLDFFIGFSTVMTMLGGAGQADYIAANAYLDAYCAYRNRDVSGTFTINWPAWSETGMAFDKGYEAKQKAFKAISNKEAVTLLDQVIRNGRSRVIAGKLNFEFITQQTLDELNLRVTDEIYEWIEKERDQPDQNNNSVVNSPVILTGKDDESYSDLEKEIAGIWYEVLGFKEIDINRSFYDLGGDSITVSKLHALIEIHYPKVMAVTDIFSCVTISSQADFIQKRLHINEKKVKQLPLPENYFVKTMKNNKKVILKYELKGKYYESLNKLSKIKKIDIWEPLFACYVNCLGETIQNDNVSLQTILREKNIVSEIDFDLSKADNIENLLSIIHEAISKSEYPASYQLEEISKLHIEREKNGVLPLVTINHLWNVSLPTKYDIILNMQLKEQEILLELNYNYKTIRYEAIASLFQQYIKIIEFILKEDL